MVYEELLRPFDIWHMSRAIWNTYRFLYVGGRKVAFEDEVLFFLNAASVGEKAAKGLAESTFKKKSSLPSSQAQSRFVVAGPFLAQVAGWLGYRIRRASAPLVYFASPDSNPTEAPPLSNTARWITRHSVDPKLQHT